MASLRQQHGDRGEVHTGGLAGGVGEDLTRVGQAPLGVGDLVIDGTELAVQVALEDPGAPSTVCWINRGC
jgi:hypothetical protein